MVNFIGIPQLRAPDNMNVDFGPINDLIETYRKRSILERGNQSLVNALQGGGQSPSSQPPMNALMPQGPSQGMGPSQPMSYGVANGPKNAMFDMGNLNTQQPGGLDPSLVQSVKGFEGYSPKASWDYKQNSNGYGTRAQYPGEHIDQATADQRLNGELGKAQNVVEQFAPNAPPGVKRALTSLTYNAGEDWTRSGLGAAVRTMCL